MSKPYMLGKFKPRLVYYGLTLEDASKVMDYYVSNYDSDKFWDNGITCHFYVRMEAEEDGDEYTTTFTGTYTVQFRGFNYSGPADPKNLPGMQALKCLEILHKLIKDELGIE